MANVAERVFGIYWTQLIAESRKGRKPQRDGRLGLLGIELPACLKQIVPVKATTKRRAKSEAKVLDHATNNLLRALKQDMLTKDGRVDREKLRKDGCQRQNTTVPTAARIVQKSIAAIVQSI